MKNTDENPSASEARRRLVLRIVGLFALSAWMFGLGVWVGRGTAPLRFDIEKLETELAEMKARLLQEEQQRDLIAREAANDRSQLDFYEALKKPGEEPLPELAAPARPGDAAGEPSQTAKPKRSLKAATRNTPPPAAAVKPPPAAKTQPPAAPPPRVAEGELTIQVASLKDPADAARLVRTLQAKGFPAYRTTGQIPGKGTWYRVRVGAFKDRGAAQGVLERLKREKFSGLVVSR